MLDSESFTFTLNMVLKEWLCKIHCIALIKQTRSSKKICDFFFWSISGPNKKMQSRKKKKKLKDSKEMSLQKGPLENLSKAAEKFMRYFPGLLLS